MKQTSMQWSVVGQVASLAWSEWQWTFALNQPRSGLHLRPPHSDASWPALQIQPLPHHTCQIDDWFCRGSDLMVRYGQSSEDRFAFQLDCRAVPALELGPYACGWDLWLSVQTQLLDSHPALELRSELPSGSWRSLSSEGYAIAGNQPAMLACDAPKSAAALLIHPSDQAQTQLRECASDARLRIFGDFMEKGVIRRGRIRCLFGTTTATAAELASLYGDFAHSPLPLTT